MRFDPARLAELVTAEAALTRQVEETAVRLNDLHSSDEAWTDQRLTEYSVLQQRHAQLLRERDSVRAERQAYELREPERSQRMADHPLTRFLRSGRRGLAAEELERMAVPDGDVVAGMPTDTVRIHLAPTRSDEASGTGSGGGSAVEEDLYTRVIDSLAYYGAAARMCWNFMTSTGGQYRFVQLDEASTEGMIEGDQGNQAIEDALAAMSVTTFSAHTSNSKFIDLTREFIQDAVFDVTSYVMRQIIRRIGRIWNRAYTLGNAAGIVGIVPSATSGAPNIAAARDAVTYPEIVDLQYRINRAYREMDEGGEGGFLSERSGRTGYMMSDGMEKIMRKMVDSDNRPLWVPSVREGEPALVAGYPYEVNAHMADPDANTASTKPLLFGNFSYYGVRTVAAIDVSMFWDSTTALTNSVRFLGHARRDGRPVGVTAGDPPICEAWAALTMAA